MGPPSVGAARPVGRRCRIDGIGGRPRGTGPTPEWEGDLWRRPGLWRTSPRRSPGRRDDGADHDGDDGERVGYGYDYDAADELDEELDPVEAAGLEPEPEVPELEDPPEVDPLPEELAPDPLLELLDELEPPALPSARLSVR